MLTWQQDYACSRYDHAYPRLVNKDARLGDPSKRNFQFRSCSGAVIDDILKEQIPQVDSGQQVILLSAGGLSPTPSSDVIRGDTHSL